MDKPGKKLTANKTGIKQAFSLRLIFILLTLVAIVPISYTITYNFDVQLYRLIASQVVSVFIIILAVFRKSQNAVLLRFLLRLSLALITGFVVFSTETIIINIVLSVYTLILLSFLSYGLFDDYRKLSILSVFVLVFNIFSGLMLRINAEFAGFGPLHGIFITISTVAVFAFFMLQNVDTSRIFGNDIMKIPASMNRAMIILLTIMCIFILIFAFMPWIQNAIEALIAIIVGVILRFFRFLLSLSRRTEYQPIVEDNNPGEPDLFPLFGDEDIVYESVEVNPVLMWVFVGLLLLVLSVLILFALVKLIVFLFKLLKPTHQRIVLNNEVFTETIEKIESTRKKPGKKNRAKRLSYSSLQTESERIKYIYHEYVRRAKLNGLTRDAISDTPIETLDEITRTIKDSRDKKDKTFPPPGNLASAFCKVRYGDCNDTVSEIKACDFLHLR